MKIAFSTDQIYLHGGIEKVLVEKANYFTEILNYEVTIITSQQRGNPPRYPLSAKVKLIDLSINYDRTISYYKLYNLKKIWIHLQRRRNSLRLINPDIVIVENSDLDLYWMPFLHKKSKKIKEFHGSQYKRQEDLSSLKSKIKNSILNFIEKKYDAIVVLSKDEQSFFKSSNTIVIPNPISIPNFQSSLDQKQVLAVGRIAPVKGFERLIEVWALVVKKYPDWVLHFYGDDYLNTKNRLQEQINKLNISESVIFKGISNNMIKTMLDYSLHLMTSHTESFSMVILEALSVGLPTVVFDVPTGPRNLINNNIDGVLIENDDINCYSNAVCDLISNTRKRKVMGHEAKKNSLIYSTANVMEKWSILFQKLKFK